MIDIDRRQEGFDRLGCLSQDHKTLPALFLQAAVARLLVLESRERSERLGDMAQKSLRDGLEQQTVPVFGSYNEQGLSGRQRLDKLPLPEQCAYP